MEEEKYYFIKLTAQDPQNKVYILVCIAVPENKSGVDRLDLVVSQNPDAIMVRNEDSYRDCRNKIQKIMLTGSPSQSATQSLTSYFRNSFSSESFMVELFHYLEHNELEKLKILLMQNIGRVMGRHDLDSESKIYVSKVTKSELESSVSLNNQESKKEEEIPVYVRPQSVPESATLLDYQLILSPVTGTPISELKKDDLIMVKIIPNTEEAISIIRDLNLKDESGLIHPCPAPIIEIIKQEIGTEIIVKFTDNAYGRCLEEEFSIKVKMYEPSVQSQEKNIQQEHTVSNEGNWFIPIMITIGVLSILWIIIYYLV